jgi:hypothetical protein
VNEPSGNAIAKFLREQSEDRISTRLERALASAADEIKASIAALTAEARNGAQNHINALGKIEERLDAIEKLLRIERPRTA